MNTDFIRGIIPPIITPVTADEKIDETALRRQVDFIIEGGVSGILAFGSNGEFYMFEEDEQLSAFEIIVDQACGRVPVYLGIGEIRTSKCIRLARMAADNGASAVSILQPMFLKPTEDELSGHIKAIAASVKELPVLLYNNPGRTGYAMSQNLVERLAHSIENLVGMKDSSGDMTQTAEFIRRNADVGFKVMCGKDTLIFGGLVHGAVGAVCSTANFLPELVCSIYEKFTSGDFTGSLEAQYKLNPIRLAMDASSFPVATKDYANLLGCDVGEPVPPSKRSPDSQMRLLSAELEKAGYLKKGLKAV